MEETRKKTNKQTEQNRTGQDRTGQRGERQKGKQHSKPLKERSSEAHSGIRRVTSYFVSFGKTTTATNKWRASPDVHDLHCREIFHLKRICKSIEAARATGHGKDANR